MIMIVASPEVMERVGLGEEEAQTLRVKSIDPDWAAQNPDGELDLTDNPVIGSLPGFKPQQRENWVEAARILYESSPFGPAPQERRKTGQLRGDPAQHEFYEEDDFGGDLTFPPKLTDAEVSEWGLELMGAFNYRPEKFLDYFANFDQMDARQKMAAYALLSGYERLPNLTWKGTSRFFRHTVKSPTTYLAVGTVGAGLVLRKAFKDAGKKGIINYIKKQVPVATAGAIEGGLYTGIDNLGKQAVEIDAARANPETAAALKMKTETDYGELAENTAMGIGAGGILSTALPAAAGGILKGAKAGWDALVWVLGQPAEKRRRVDPPVLIAHRSSARCVET